ncbi:MAG: shikimate dehydrogenase [Coriobacteriia bacterium]|nr:shikimate dehydrogenase [Coriobacteriia bacterium]
MENLDIPNGWKQHTRVGLVGYPIDHSLSPVIHTAAYEALGLDWEYGLYPCENAAVFEAFVAEAVKRTGKENGFLGLNVTMPYKSEAFACSNEVFAGVAGQAAHTARAANVLSFEAGSELEAAQPLIRSANTDGAGICRFLEREASLDLQGISAIVCGTGPTSAAAAFELEQAGAASVVVLSRNAKGDGTILSHFPVASYEDRDVLEQLCAESSLIIDATPVGMKAGDGSVIPPELILPHHTVLDVVYGHGETEILKAARAKGARGFDGLGMLIEQAALTIELWATTLNLKVTAPREIMLQAAQAELRRRSH